MITEYYTEEDLINEFNVISLRVSKMLKGWLGAKLSKILKKPHNGSYTQELTYKKQKYILTIVWFDTFEKYSYKYNISTKFEGGNGCIHVSFTSVNQPIMVYTPHYKKRYKERGSVEDFYSKDLKFVPYKRNNKDYELIDLNDDIIITRRSNYDKRLVFCITTLSRDMCTSKNYKELLSRVDKTIDTDDIYTWK